MIKIHKSGMTLVMPLFESPPEALVSEDTIPVCGHKTESFGCFFAEKITKISRQKIASPSHTDAEWFWKGARWM